MRKFNLCLSRTHLGKRTNCLGVFPLVLLVFCSDGGSRGLIQVVGTGKVILDVGKQTGFFHW